MVVDAVSCVRKNEDHQNTIDDEVPCSVTEGGPSFDPAPDPLTLKELSQAEKNDYVENPPSW